MFREATFLSRGPRIPYKLKPVVNYHLGWGGRGWVGGFLGMTRLSEGTVEEGLVFANIALKETI